MPGQHIWHIKVRRAGRTETETAEPQLDRRRAPLPDEVFEATVQRERLRVKVTSFHTSVSPATSTYTHTIEAVEEDDGNTPGHREANENDFRR